MGQIFYIETPCTSEPPHHQNRIPVPKLNTFETATVEGAIEAGRRFWERQGYYVIGEGRDVTAQVIARREAALRGDRR